MLENDATTLWENWDYPDQNSLNHPMFGSVSEWFYRSLAGINPSQDAIGFDKVSIKPSIVGDLQKAEGLYKSIKGQISSSWERIGSKVKLEIHVPPNIITTIHIPTKDPHTIMVNHEAALSNAELNYIEFDGSYAIFKAGNGNFEISTEL
jgi:alpha-L-rhamnosidase